MLETSRLPEASHTEAPESYAVRLDQTPGHTQATSTTKFSSKASALGRTSTPLTTEQDDGGTRFLSPARPSEDEDAKKNQRARANALMDAECLPLLKLFNDRKTLYIDELTEHLVQPRDWLKISLLIRADFLEALDSTVRITPDGLAAWRSLSQFKRLRDDSK